MQSTKSLLHLVTVRTKTVIYCNYYTIIACKLSITVQSALRYTCIPKASLFRFQNEYFDICNTYVVFHPSADLMLATGKNMNVTF